MEVYGYIYLIRNKVNGKVYIGQTIYPIKERWRRHLYYAQGTGQKTRFVSALRAHGKDGFDVVELGRAFSKDELNAMEVRAIWTHDATNHDLGYNDELGGNGSGRRSAEYCAEQSRRSKGRVFSPIALANLRKGSDKLIGRKATPEAKAKMSATRKGRKRSPATAAKIAENNRRRNVARKGIPLSEEHKQKLRGRVPHNKGMKMVLSDEQRARLSDAAKKRGSPTKGRQLVVKRGPCGFYGVSQYMTSKGDRYMGRLILSDGKRVGKAFDTAIEAAQWRDEQSLIHYKELAVLNFPLPQAA